MDTFHGINSRMLQVWLLDLLGFEEALGILSEHTLKIGSNGIDSIGTMLYKHKFTIFWKSDGSFVILDRNLESFCKRFIWCLSVYPVVNYYFIKRVQLAYEKATVPMPSVQS